MNQFIRKNSYIFLDSGNFESATTNYRHFCFSIGLDPALPSFSLKNRITRLDSSDAAFVDVIHTNGGQLGFPWSIGHIDFYVNGGALQPRCPFADYRTLNSSNKCTQPYVFTAMSCLPCKRWLQLIIIIVAFAIVRVIIGNFG